MNGQSYQKLVPYKKYSTAVINVLSDKLDFNFQFTRKLFDKNKLYF